jgi:hypothetical protein
MTPGGGWAGGLAGIAACLVGSAAGAQAVGRFPEPGAPAASATPPTSATPPPPATSAPAVDPGASRYPRTPAWSPPPLAPSTTAPSAAPAGGFYPAVLPYRDGQPVPPGYRLEERRNRGLTTGGLVTFGVAYATGLGYAAAKGFEDGTGWLALPVAGPWAAIGAQEIECNKRSLENDCVEQALGGAERITFMTVDGLIQAVGLTLVFVGIGVKTSELVRNDVAALRLELRPRYLGMSGNF